jgi:hypothetical protein
MCTSMADDKPKRDRMVSVRLYEWEEKRLQDVSSDIMKRNSYLTQADVLRELLSIVDTGVVTKADRERLKGKEGLGDNPGNMIKVPFVGSANANDRKEQKREQNGERKRKRAQ